MSVLYSDQTKNTSIKVDATSTGALLPGEANPPHMLYTPTPTPRHPHVQEFDARKLPAEGAVSLLLQLQICVSYYIPINAKF